jgi:hypothetical protein
METKDLVRSPYKIAWYLEARLLLHLLGMPQHRRSLVGQHVAKAYPELQEIRLAERPPGRDTYVGYHRDLRRLTRLRRLLDLVIARLG